MNINKLSQFKDMILVGREYHFKARDIPYVLKKEVFEEQIMYVIQLQHSRIDAVSNKDFDQAIMHVLALCGDISTSI